MNMKKLATTCALSFISMAGAYAGEKIHPANLKADKIVTEGKITRQEDLTDFTLGLIPEKHLVFVCTNTTPHYQYEIEQCVTLNKEYMMTRVFVKKGDARFSVGFLDYKTNGIGNGDFVSMSFYLPDFTPTRVLGFTQERINEIWQLAPNHRHDKPLIEFNKVTRWYVNKYVVNDIRNAYENTFKPTSPKAKEELDSLIANLDASYFKRLDRCKKEDSRSKPDN